MYSTLGQFDLCIVVSAPWSCVWCYKLCVADEDMPAAQQMGMLERLEGQTDLSRTMLKEHCSVGALPNGIYKNFMTWVFLMDKTAHLDVVSRIAAVSSPIKYSQDHEI